MFGVGDDRIYCLMGLKYRINTKCTAYTLYVVSNVLCTKLIQVCVELSNKDNLTRTAT